MKVLDLIKKSRSYRRFDESKPIKDEELNLMIEAARFSPSSRNIQPIKYVVSNSAEMNSKIFSTLGWAGYLTDWDGPAEGERPAAYIIQVLDTEIAGNCSCDNGITAQSILLQAVELGYGGCIIASVKREGLSNILGLEPRYSIIQVIAFGVPVEKVMVDDMENNNFKYWREENGTHHVPKRTVEELILKRF